MSAVYPNPGRVQGTGQTLTVTVLKHRHVICHFIIIIIIIITIIYFISLFKVYLVLI